MLEGHKELINQVAFSRDGRLIISTDGRDVRIWGTQDGKERRRFQAGQDWDARDYPRAFSLTLDGTLLLVAGGYSWSTEKKTVSHGFIAIWRTSDWTQIEKLGLHDYIDTMDVRPDGKQLAYGMRDSVGILDLGSFRTLGRLKHKLRYESPIKFSPDGGFLVAPNVHGRIVIWTPTE